ncbi:MAG: Bacteriophage replication protein O [Syntrophorhabdaceae bacterium PtaU1.Bin034]|nr:MAG: Bacteriophage replication protein O [Syntrophorhabdaceae bacterium PtaU1.Bin034]
MRTNLSACQSRILWAIWRKTYGYQKKQDWLSNSQLVEMTGIRKSHVSRTMSELIARNIVTKAGNKVGFNKDYTQWRELPKRVTVTNSGNKVTDWGYRSYQSGGTQKKKILKKDILSTESTPPCPHQEIIKAFHEICSMLPCVRVWNDTRQSHLQARWREDKERQDLEWWKDFFRYITSSPFLTGKVSTPDRKPFLASLNWIIKPENFAKIIEGKYQ